MNFNSKILIHGLAAARHVYKTKHHFIIASGLPLQLGAVSFIRFEKNAEVEKEYYSEGISIDS